MITRAHDALLLDLDGTLLDAQDRVHPRTRAALLEARSSGVLVMVVTGRSLSSAQPVLEDLGLDSLAVIFNGAAVWNPTEGRLVEERVLSGRTLRSLHAYRQLSGDMTIVMSAARKLTLEPRSDAERRSLDGLPGVEFVDQERLIAEEHVLRVTFLNTGYERSEDYARALLAEVPHPVYTTHFPLHILPRHRESPFQAVDVHAPCRGKAEALRVIADRYAILPEKVVAVGDAWNDLPMITAAGLGVAMGNAVGLVRRSADRVIGDHDGDALGALIEELFIDKR